MSNDKAQMSNQVPSTNNYVTVAFVIPEPDRIRYRESIIRSLDPLVTAKG